MDSALPRSSSPSSLPALRLDMSGRARVDVRAIIALAVPFAANSAIQAILNLTDTWFVGRISTTALAAIAALGHRRCGVSDQLRAGFGQLAGAVGSLALRRVGKNPAALKPRHDGGVRLMVFLRAMVGGAKIPGTCSER